MLYFLSKNFEELSPQELHDLYALRSEVFVVEQKCIYQDIDGKDPKAIHIIGFQEKEIVAYARVFDKGNSYSEYASIGRIVVAPNHRNKKIGKLIVEHSIRFIKENYKGVPIKISAQEHLQKFYNEIGFTATGEAYLEDGIPHIGMVLR